MSICVHISRLQENDIDTMEKKLVVELQPKQKNARKPQASWKPIEKVRIVRKEGEDRVLIPFNWGVTYFGKSLRRPREQCGRLLSKFGGKLRPEQQQIFQESVALLNQSGSCLMAIYPGGGKCLGRGTPVRMWDGSVKNVEDIVPGDVLVGDDHGPRNVRSVCRGREPMVKIAHRDFDGLEYRVNRSHILTLVDSSTNQLADVPVEELLSQTTNELSRYRGVYFDYDHPEAFPLRARRSTLLGEIVRLGGYFPFSASKVREVMLCGMAWHPVPGSNTFRVEDPRSVLSDRDQRVRIEYPIRLELEEEDDYFGFEIDGNRRFLLGNGVCTHNTVTSLSIASAVGSRTMIFVNKLVLIDQWLDTIYKWFGPETGVQVIQGKSRVLQPDKDFYIVNAVNVPKHPFDEYQKLGVGMLIVDECHLMLTRVFSQALSYICPRYLMGLSATPYRFDGFDLLHELYFGLHKVHRKLFRPHVVYCLETKIAIEHDRDARGDIIWNSVIEKQTSDKKRNRRIADLCLQHHNRNILILSKRIKQIEEIFALLEQAGQDATMMKENENSFDRDARILIATFQKVGTGFSHDKLDMLILASDTEEYFIQYLGRVFRRPDVEPVIIDIVDKHPILKRHFQSRKKVYEASGGRIEMIS